MRALSITLFRRSQGSAGQGFNDISDFPALSADGAYVAFSTDATNGFLVDSNNAVDIWRQSVGGALERVSLTTSGAGANDSSFAPAISADGRYVAFASFATNMTLNDVNGLPDIFRRDMLTGAVLLVSAGADGLPGNSLSIAPTISADGRTVAYLSFATNLVTNDLNNATDTFLTDLVTGVTRLVSAAADGAQASAGSLNRPSLSADARFVAFDSAAANLTAADANDRDDVFVKDMLTGAIRRASEGPGGEAMGGGLEGTLRPALSADGRYVVFATAAAMLPGDTNGVIDIYRKDLLTGGLVRVSVTAGGLQGNAESREAAISGDGQMVSFTSLASNFVDADGDGNADVFLKDMVSGALTLISRTPAGTPGFGQSVSSAISADGRLVAFASNAPDLVPGDANMVQDVFTAQLGSPSGTLTGTAGANDLRGTEGADTLLGLAGDDTLQGYGGPDRLEGAEGSDLLLGGPGNDAMIGGPGDDIYQIDSPGDSMVEQEDEGSDTAYIGVAGYALPANIDIARLYDSADAVAGGDVAEQLVANAALGSLLDGAGGDDVLWGQGQDDTLVGGAGDDLLRPGGGQDRILGGQGNDQAVIEQPGDVFLEYLDAGIDTAWITAQGWTLPVHVEIGRLAGTATLLSGSAGGQSLVANPLFGSTLLAGDGLDTLYGSALADTLDGGAGDDVLYGGPGADLLRGGAGNDSYVIDDIGDRIMETAGIDTAYVTVNDHVLGPGVEVAYLADGASRLNGAESDETLVGNPFLSNAIDGRGGADTMYGSPHADLFAGGLGNDVTYGMGGADIFAFHIANWGEDWVMDFNRADGDLLDFRGSGVVGFGQLTLTMNSPHAAVIHGSNSVTLWGASYIVAADCVF